MTNVVKELTQELTQALTREPTRSPPLVVGEEPALPTNSDLDGAGEYQLLLTHGL